MPPIFSEYTRPWKLITLMIGIGLLVAGSFHYEALDWDIPISLIMAILTYLTAPWSLRVVVERRWKHLPAMLFATWFSVDGCYWIYWHFKNPLALELLRIAFAVWNMRRHLVPSRKPTRAVCGC